MACIIDRAQKNREQQERNTINAHKTRIKETPDIDEHGRHWCVGCEEPIPLERILAHADAVRCIDCQSLKEQKERK